MRRGTTYLILILLLLPSLSFIAASAHGDEVFSSSDIVIDGDQDLSSSPYVSSGDGSASNPYRISDIAMGSGSVRIANTTRSCVLENITFSSGDDHAIFLDYVQNLRISWITIDGRLRVLKAVGCVDLSIGGMRVLNISQRGVSIDLSDVDKLTMAHSQFETNDPSRPAYIMMDLDCSDRVIRNNTFDGFFLNLQKFGSGEKIIENRFLNSTLELFNSTEAGLVMANEFNSTLYTGVYYQTSVGVVFENNRFRCVKGIYLQTSGYVYQTNTVLRGNVFESCGKGISTDPNDMMSRLLGWIAYDNKFLNCTGLAINTGYGYYNIFYRNIFYHNAGTDDSTPGPQVSQSYGGTGYYFNQWTYNDMGNFWANHRTPDVDGNGIVDTPYLFSVSGEDTLPYSNILFDTERPVVSILSPAPGRIANSYQRVRWDASDDAGIVLQRLIVDGLEYNVTGKDLKSLYLEKGKHDIVINVTDGCGLTNMTYVNVTLDRTTDIVNIIEPADKEYVPSLSIPLNWTVISAFHVTEQSLMVNGNEFTLSPDMRNRQIEMVEGINTIVLKVVDDGDLEIMRTITVTADVKAPTIDVICPAPGSCLTNELVKFRWSVRDVNPIALVETKLDNGTWTKRDISEMNVMTSSGIHTFSIRARDIAGNVYRKDIPFTIGEDPHLMIISPQNGLVTRINTIEFTWDYTGVFNFTSVYVRVGNSSQFIDVGGARSFDIMLERSTRADDEGAYFITLKLEDEYGNYLETSTSVIRDNTAPRVVFDLPDEFPNTNRSKVLLKWRGIDDWGISSYSICVNEGEWEQLGDVSEYELILQEGGYLVQVRAEDRGGNIGRGEITFFVDRTPPSLEITDPETGSMLKAPEVIFRWKVSDQGEIDNVTFVMDGSVRIDVTGMTMLSRTVLDEGFHLASITAVDTCGNRRTRQVSFTVDLTPPLVDWSDQLPVLVNSSRINVSWSVKDLVGLLEQKLLIDGEERQLDLADRNLTIEFEDGVHSLELFAVDLAERESTVSFQITVDTRPPAIVFDQVKCNVEGNIARVYWEASDEVSGVLEGSIMISIDGGAFTLSPLEDRYFTDVLPPGDHYILVKARDNAGNEFSEKWEFSIEEAKDASTGKGGVGGAVAIVVAVVLLLAIASVLIYIFMRKGEKVKQGPSINKPQKLTIAMPAPRGRAAIGPSSAPALPSKKVEESSTGAGYIRPEKNGSQRPSTLTNGNTAVEGAPATSVEDQGPDDEASPKS